MEQIRLTYKTALGYEPGVTRRDPSPVICHDGIYYVWYSKATFDTSGYHATIWYATSADGHQWEEACEALPAGNVGSWDDHAVFTPTVLCWEDRFYLIYTAVQKPFDSDNGGPNGTPTAIGLVVANHPSGPWRRVNSAPILRPATDVNATDSHRVDDACIVVRESKVWLYYKGRQKGYTPAQTKMHLATAERPEGPYVKCDRNPVLDSGHEVCVWPHNGGVMCLVSATGPQGQTLQFSEDGIHFDKIADVESPPAPGPYREDNFVDGARCDLAWGTCHNLHDADRPYLVRFDARPPVTKAAVDYIGAPR